MYSHSCSDMILNPCKAKISYVNSKMKIFISAYIDQISTPYLIFPPFLIGAYKCPRMVGSESCASSGGTQTFHSRRIYIKIQKNATIIQRHFLHVQGFQSLTLKGLICISTSGSVAFPYLFPTAAHFHYHEETYIVTH